MREINYVGKKLKYRFTVDTINAAQDLIDLYRSKGIEAAATHKNGLHQIYSELVC